MKETVCLTIRPLANTAPRSPAVFLDWSVHPCRGKCQSVPNLQGPLPLTQLVILLPPLLPRPPFTAPPTIKNLHTACFTAGQKPWVVPYHLGNNVQTTLALNAPNSIPILYVTPILPPRIPCSNQNYPFIFPKHIFN